MLTRKEVLEEYHNDILRKIVKQEIDSKQHKEQSNLDPASPESKVRSAFEKSQNELSRVQALQKANQSVPIKKVQKAETEYNAAAKAYSMQEMRRMLRITEDLMREDK